jgi:hypothetical protein
MTTVFLTRGMVVTAQGGTGAGGVYFPGRGAGDNGSHDTSNSSSPTSSSSSSSSGGIGMGGAVALWLSVGVLSLVLVYLSYRRLKGQERLDDIFRIEIQQIRDEIVYGKTRQTNVIDREHEQGLQLPRNSEQDGTSSSVGMPKNGVYYAEYSKAARGRKEVEKELSLEFLPRKRRRRENEGRNDGEEQQLQREGPDYYKIEGSAIHAAGYTKIVQGYLSARTGKAYWVERKADGAGLLLLSIVTFDWETNRIIHSSDTLSSSSWRTRYGRTGTYKRLELRTLVSIADQNVNVVEEDEDDVKTLATEGSFFS